MTTVLEDRVALVTGGFHGIGRAVAELLAKAGAHVLSLDLEQDPAAQPDQSVVSIEGDVRHAGDVARAVNLCIDRWGRLDIAIANAGVAAVEPLLSTEDETWNRIVDTNLTGAFITVREAARAMVRTGGGAIVAVASTNAFWAETNMAAYNTSKAGVVALVRSAAMDLAPHGIRVNAVSPGLVRTRLTTFITDDTKNAESYLEQIPLSRFGTPSDVGQAILFLVSDAAGWITGVNLVLDGGQTLGTAVPSPGATWLDE